MEGKETFYMREPEVAISDKYALTIKEAAVYFGIGEKKLRSIANEVDQISFHVGTRLLFKRALMEKYLNKVSSV